jgi:hypothetical protein
MEGQKRTQTAKLTKQTLGENITRAKSASSRKVSFSNLKQTGEEEIQKFEYGQQSKRSLAPVLKSNYSDVQFNLIGNL